MTVDAFVEKRWWILLLAIVLVAGGLRFSVYPAAVPYLDQPDEASFPFGAAGYMHNMRTYPPAYPAIYWVLQGLLNDPGGSMLRQIVIMRFGTIVVNLGCLVLIALLARQIAGPAAGLLAGMLWAIEPAIINESRYALPDSYVVLFMLGALFAVVMLFRTKRARWIYFGAASGLLAFLFKYHILPVIPVILVAPLVYPLERRPWKPVLISGVIAAALIAWILFGYGGLAHGLRVRQPVDLAAQGFQGPLDYLARNFINSVGTYGIVLVVATVGLGLGLAWRARRREFDLWTLALVAGTLAIFWLGISVFREQPYRRVYPLVAMLLVLAGSGLSTYLYLPRVKYISWLIIVLLLVPTAIAAWGKVQYIRLPDRRAELMQWADASLTTGSYIGGDMAYHRVFSPMWGIYEGVTDFPLHQIAPIIEKPVEIWQDEGVRYALLGDGAYQQLLDTPEIGQPYIDQTLLLKTFSPAPGWRGPSFVVLYMSVIEQPVDVRFGDEIELVGYDLSAEVVRPGDVLTLTYYWQAANIPDEAYNVFTHLVPLDSFEPVVQTDATPVSERRPTLSWNDPEEILIGQPLSLHIDEEVLPGEYRLLTGLYVWYDGRRLPVVGQNADYIELARITVSE